MKKKYVTALALLGLFAMPTLAVEEPSIPSKTLESGGVYTLLNKCQPQKYLTRTTWDGALFLSNSTAYQNLTFTATKASDSGWLFQGTTATVWDSEALGYIGNTGGNTNFIESEYKWEVAASETPGFYTLTVAQNQLYDGYKLDLNAGKEYVIVGENQWNGSDDWASEYNWAFCDAADIPLYDARWKLYTAIQNALTALGESTDEAFTAAITAASNLYTESAPEVESLTEAVTTLQTAQKTFEENQATYKAPGIPTATLEDGGVYVFMNRCQPQRFMNRTAWDGAIYFTADGAYENYAFTAHKTSIDSLGLDNLWYFEGVSTTVYGSEAIGYVGNRMDVGNTNFVADKFYWTIEESTFPGYYYIVSATGLGQFHESQQLDLNTGKEYALLGECYWNGALDIANEHNFAFCTLDGMKFYKAKLNLYAALNKMEETYAEETDALLLKAIADVAAFYNAGQGTQTDYEAQLKALEDAVTDYLSRTQGDITATALVNPSFEDLSAQEGATTVNVANPPYGWKIAINGKECTTKDEIIAAGIANWCGVNGDCDAATRDGNYGFGIWTANVPEFELYQEVSGLENGIYMVSANLMVSANGTTSRLTTQRIFAGNNSTYYGHIYDYTELNLASDENVDYANYDETTGDVATLQRITVKAVVADGTLRLGLKTNNVDDTGWKGNAGQGWFKVDNFRLMKSSFDNELMLKELEATITIAQSLVDLTMQSTVVDALWDAIDAASAAMTSTNSEVCFKALTDLRNAIEKARASISAYVDFAEAIVEGEANMNAYGDFESFYDYGDKLMELMGIFDEGSYNEAQIAQAIGELKALFNTCYIARISDGADISNMIVNRSFETGNYEGWTVSSANLTWCGTNSDGDAETKDGENIFGIWHATIPDWQLSQTISGLPAGYYQVTCGLMGSCNAELPAGSRLTTQRLFANNHVQYFGAESDYNASLLPAGEERTFAGHVETQGDASALQEMSVTTGINAGQDLSFGIRTNSAWEAVTYRTAANASNGDGWFKVDNFGLTCIQLEEGAGVKNTVSEASVVRTRLFNTAGMQLQSLQKGVNLIRYELEDGTFKVAKIWVK